MKTEEYRKLHGKNKRFVIGIDAGVKSGFAVLDRLENEWSATTVDFHYLYNLEGFAPEDTLVIIEKPKKGFAYPQRHRGASRQLTEKVAFNAGENNREATLLIERFERRGFLVKAITPTSAKWTAWELERFTGIAARTSEHARDAARLVWAHGG